MLNHIFALILAVSSVKAFPATEYSSTEAPTPFVYAYASGRAPNGKPDRYVVSSGDKYGRVEGTYSYLDPNWKWQKVSYVADPDKGFIVTDSTDYLPAQSPSVQRAKLEHETLYAEVANRVPGPNKESPAVAAARQRHQELYQQIASEHAAIEAQREAEKAAAAGREASSELYYY